MGRRRTDVTDGLVSLAGRHSSATLTDRRRPGTARRLPIQLAVYFPQNNASNKIIFMTKSRFITKLFQLCCSYRQ